MKVIDQALLEKSLLNAILSAAIKEIGRLLCWEDLSLWGAIIMSKLLQLSKVAGLRLAVDKENIPALHSHLPEAMKPLKDQQLLKRAVGNMRAEVVLGPSERIWRRTCKTSFRLRKDQILIVDGAVLWAF